MKRIATYIQEKLIVNNTIQGYNYHPKTKEELQRLLWELVSERGIEADLNDVDTSQITDMAYLFHRSTFNGDISKWDVSKVKNMYGMFFNSNFTGENGDINNWDVSNVENMGAMFMYSEFNGNISKWKVKKHTNIDKIFKGSPIEIHKQKHFHQI